MSNNKIAICMTHTNKYKAQKKKYKIYFILQTFCSFLRGELISYSFLNVFGVLRASSSSSSPRSKLIPPFFFYLVARLCVFLRVSMRKRKQKQTKKNKNKNNILFLKLLVLLHFHFLIALLILLHFLRRF